ncbi:MAG: hypothetical protein RLZZ282_1425, partial [Verrucomicrobiota bacterium]
ATFSISNSLLDNLTGNKEFRIYQWNTNGALATGRGGLVIDQQTTANQSGFVAGNAAGENIILQGAVAAIPEPNVAALLGSMGILALLRRRRA